jgi:Tfp pilus assembly protein PilN
MKDLNFFEPYIEKHEFAFTRIIFLYLLLAICICAISIYGIHNQMKINELNKQVQDRRTVIEDSNTIKKVNEIKKLEIELNNFKNEVNNMIEIDMSIESNNKVNEKLLKEIRNKMPSELFLTSFSAFENEIQISGISKDTYSVAEFEKGLGLIKDMDSVFISNISNTENYFNFELNLTLKDVSLDGTKTSEEQGK